MINSLEANSILIFSSFFFIDDISGETYKNAFINYFQIGRSIDFMQKFNKDTSEYVANNLFSVLMGNDVETRREFIETNAKFVRNLDV